METLVHTWRLPLNATVMWLCALIAERFVPCTGTNHFSKRRTESLLGCDESDGSISCFQFYDLGCDCVAHAVGSW